ncbi:hypothetical protein QE152_g32295 [Popillia japonica]|uniref:Uncharacterized protein n=1 Tax=Popillia japonica TaxID=7064 RepID=A0AAW1IZG8_POPJA
MLCSNTLFPSLADYITPNIAHVRHGTVAVALNKYNETIYDWPLSIIQVEIGPAGLDNGDYLYPDGGVIKQDAPAAARDGNIKNYVRG